MHTCADVVVIKSIKESSVCMYIRCYFDNNNAWLCRSLYTRIYDDSAQFVSTLIQEHDISRVIRTDVLRMELLHIMQNQLDVYMWNNLNNYKKPSQLW